MAAERGGELLALCYSSSSVNLWSRNAGSGYRPGNYDGFDYMLHDDQIMQVLLQSLEGNWYFTFLEMVISSPMILMEIRNGNAIFKKIMEIFAFNGLFQRPLLSTKENFTYQSYREMNLFMGAASKEQSRSCCA